MTWWNVGIAVATAIGTAWQADQVAQRQDNIAAMNIQNQSRAEQSATAKVNEMLQQVSQSNPEDARRQRMDEYLATLAQGTQTGAINDGPGGFSDAYRQGVEQAEGALGTYGDTRAGLMARLDAPVIQRMNEGVLFDDTAAGIREIGRSANQDDFLARLRIDGTRANPWVQAGLQAAGAYGSAAAGKGAGTGGTSAWSDADLDWAAFGGRAPMG
jgi:hypothetical protein